MQRFEFTLEENLLYLHNELRSGSYRVGLYTSFYIQDPKLRHIHKASVRDRVVFQAMYRVLAPIFEKEFIYDSFSSRIGKGTHAGVNRLERFLRKASANGTRPAFILKCDIRKFFDSIDHEILYQMLCVRIADENTRRLLWYIIESFRVPASAGMMKKGVPLGNVTSQLFANIYLHELDFFVKHQLRIKYYAHYCDDFTVVDSDRVEFPRYIVAMRDFLRDQLRLELHPKKIIMRSYSRGIDFLGYVLRPHHRLLRKRTRRRMLRRITPSNAPSYLGMLLHCNGHKLEQRIRVCLHNLLY